MKKKLLTSFSFLLIFLYNVQSQEVNLSALTLDSNAKENANAVVRSQVMEVTVNDIDQLNTKYRYIVTILNKVGHQQFSDMVAFYDDDSKVKKISAKIYNAFGKEIKKYNRNKFTDVSAVSGGSLYEDDRVLYVDYTPISYPYTYVFEVERTSKTTGFIPSWRPLSSYYLTVQESIYRFVNKSKSEVRIKEKNFDGYPIEKKNTENGFEYKAENIKAIKYESYAPYLRRFSPELKVSLTNFSLKGVKGQARNWKEFGLWMHKELIDGRAVLPESTKSKVLSLVKGIEDPIERAKTVYKYMQDKTRYISVQVGIGGWEPIAANQVDKVGYGDCKGLTNYMKALLDVVGVTSYYTVVHAQQNYSMDEDFACIEGNHVILNIPNNGKDIWLECTSQTIPFGFLGDFTDNRKVLVVTPEGGIIKQTSSYLNEDNFQLTKATIELSDKGDVKAKVWVESKGIEYDEKYWMSDESHTELKKYYKTRRWSYNNNLEVQKVGVENLKDSLILKENLETSIANFASVGNEEMLFRANVFNKNGHVPNRYRNRKLSMRISRGYKHKDEFEITIPDGFKITGLPLPKVLKTKFGEYIVTIQKLEENKLLYKKTLLIKKGDYPKEDYDLYRRFRKSIAKYENLRISLTKI